MGRAAADNRSKSDRIAELNAATPRYGQCNRQALQLFELLACNGKRLSFGRSHRPFSFSGKKMGECGAAAHTPHFPRRLRQAATSPHPLVQKKEALLMSFTEHNVNGLIYDTSDVITAAGSGAVHAFTTRHGGVSPAPYDSLNFADNKGDTSENLLENYRRLGEAVEQGLLDESEIDESVLKVLKLKFEKGLFEHPYMEENMLTPEEAGIPEVSLSLARESAVLLKNEESVLPLAKKYKKVAVIGYHAADRYCMLGDYTPPVPESECVTVLQGMKQEAPEGVEVSYAMGSEFSEADEDEKAKALALAAKSDVIVAVVGGSSSRFGGAVFDANGAASKGTGSRSMDCGEGMDTAKVHIPAAQEELVAELARLGKPMVTVVIAGRAYCIEDIENASNALLYAFYPGPMGGKAVAEMLYGTTNPSGRLPVSMPRHAGQIPVCYNYRTSVVPAYCDMTSQPLHTFGEGKSYTTFACSDVSVNKEENGAAVSFTVENTGAMAGTSVPCLYVRKRSGGVVARIKELKAFTRISLAPGEKKEVSFQLSKEEMNFVQIPGKPEVICHDYELMLEDGAEKWWSGNVTEM